MRLTSKVFQHLVFWIYAYPYWTVSSCNVATTPDDLEKAPNGTLGKVTSKDGAGPVEEPAGPVLRISVQSNDPRDVHFYAFSRTTDKTYGLKIGMGEGGVGSLRVAGFKKSNTLVIIVHGLGDEYSSSEMKPLASAYVKTLEQFNVVCVDWNKLANSGLPQPIALASYFSALKNVPVVGGAITGFIGFMKEAGYLDMGMGSVHLIGHSVGAHVMGSAGYQIQKAFGERVGRITGLDPAGPFIGVIKSKDRISRSKGTFVDVLHTEVTFQGTPVPLGHIDFYANGGKVFGQKDCFTLDNFITTEAKNFTIFCAHGIGMRYYGHSIRGAKLWACPCRETIGVLSDKIPCPRPRPTCKSPVLFGEHTAGGRDGKYYLTIPSRHFP